MNRPTFFAKAEGLGDAKRKTFLRDNGMALVNGN